ncbi:MAG TPA: hypothetical protein VGE73_11425, partial [Pseudolabrys sp.]
MLPMGSTGSRVPRGIILSLAVAALAAGGVVAPAMAQPKADRTVTGSISSAVKLPNGGAKGWSGESGSSGHPEMTAEAIRAAADDFP